MNEPLYLVAGCKSWNRRVFEEEIRRLPGQWRYLGSPEELAALGQAAAKARYLFFLHWSWKVSTDLLEACECVCFHMTDVPYGRGGSPLQNLILRGHRETRLTALRMTPALDAGPVYLKEPLSLEGTAEEILLRASRLSAKMIETMIRLQPVPVAQAGKPTMFKRRKPEESELPALPSLSAVHDFIRMLDGEGYPKAFLVHKGFRFEFNRAALYDGRILADVTITPEAGS